MTLTLNCSCGTEGEWSAETFGEITALVTDDGWDMKEPQCPRCSAAETAERKVAAADALRKRWARDARDGEARGSSYALTYREAANSLRDALKGATP